MSVFALKLVAVVCMLLDHIGYAVGSAPLRCIGRLAFPIYAFLIGNGFRYTSNPGHYFLRLLLLAAVSQIPYTLFLFHTVSAQKLNIFFPLAFGLGWLWALSRCTTAGKKLACSAIALAVCALWNAWIPMDYGLRGVVLIVVLFFCDAKSWTMAAAFCAVYYLPIWNALLTATALPSGWNQTLFGAAALPLLYFYNQELGYWGKSAKAIQWGFYVFYPVHLLALWLIFA